MIFHYLAVLLMVLAGGLPWAVAEGKDLSAERRQFLEARRALKRGDRAQFYRLAQGLKSYPLYPYLRYDDLYPRLKEASSREVGEFLNAYPGTPPAERLRSAWLMRLARAGDWSTYLAQYVPQNDVVLRCYHLEARLRTNDLEWVLQDAKELWLVGKDQPKACDPAFEYLGKSQLMGRELVWERIRLAMAAENPSFAEFLGKRLSLPDQNWVSLWAEAHRSPATVLRSPALGQDDPIAREIFAYGVMRLARKDAGKAYALWSELKSRRAFTEPVLGEVARALALAAVAQNHPQARQWLDAMPQAAVDAEVQRARLRMAVATSDWRSLVRWTEQEAAPEMNGPRWRYWRARALEQTGDKQRAGEIYRALANEADYYGLLAADRLGLPYPLQTRPIPVDKEEEAALAAQPGVIRASELYLAGLRHEARVEWGEFISALEESQLPVAATIAHRWGWHDRAILTLGKARALSDLEMRFPMPYRDLVQAYARARGLDMALLYGFIRAESGFWEDARSSAGALGLMQLMPATGWHTARKHGVGLVSTEQLLEPGKNVQLGSAFLKDMLSRFQENIPMAAAAYNAGPGRVGSWQPGSDCQSAERWVELIPFTETRRYVRNILFYTSVYQWRMGQPVQRLTSRLAAVPPNGALAASALTSCSSTPSGKYTVNYRS